VPTVTDASVALGYIDPARFAGGTMRLRPDLAVEAIDRVIARPLGMTVEQAALGIHRVLNAQMAEATRLVSIGRGIDPRGFALLPLGGGGPMHACALAEDLGITAISIPAHPGVLSAAGLLGAPVEHEVAAAFPCALSALDSKALGDALRELDDRCAALMQAEGIADAEVRHYVDVCYVGQSYHLSVPLLSHDPAVIYEAFLAEHGRVYGHSTSVPAKIVNIRSVHRSMAGAVAIDAAPVAAIQPPAQRMIRIRTGSVQAAIWQRNAFTPDTIVPGPAIIEQADTTTLVEPGWTARLAPGGALLLERIA
jgi:N-methylhydantoinase A/oxoprolinase/acetone carboxylase beta subunit